MLMHRVTPTGVMLSAIFIAWFISMIILLSSSFLQRLLGKRGIIACERLMGLILILIAVEMLLQGVTVFMNR
jgi:multiple antibiotic resistance protein